MFNNLKKIYKAMMRGKKTPREISNEISEGKREPEHLGKHTPETLTQELFSLKNTKPAFRDKKWHEKYEKILRLINEIPEKRVREGIQSKARALLTGEQ